MSVSILRSCVRSGLGVVLLWGGTLGLSGCAKSKPLVEFPTLKALQRIAAQPVRPQLRDDLGRLSQHIAMGRKDEVDTLPVTGFGQHVQ